MKTSVCPPAEPGSTAPPADGVRGGQGLPGLAPPEERAGEHGVELAAEDRRRAEQLADVDRQLREADPARGVLERPEPDPANRGQLAQRVVA